MSVSWDDALATLEAMFHDVDKEVLSSILASQSARIEAALVGARNL